MTKGRTEGFAAVEFGFLRDFPLPSFCAERSGVAESIVPLPDIHSLRTPFVPDSGFCDFAQNDERFASVGGDKRTPTYAGYAILRPMAGRASLGPPYLASFRLFSHRNQAPSSDSSHIGQDSRLTTCAESEMIAAMRLWSTHDPSLERHEPREVRMARGTADFSREPKRSFLGYPR
jgi:hypothetical protein